MNYYFLKSVAKTYSKEKYTTNGKAGVTFSRSLGSWFTCMYARALSERGRKFHGKYYLILKNCFMLIYQNFLIKSLSFIELHFLKASVAWLLSYNVPAEMSVVLLIHSKKVLTPLLNDSFCPLHEIITNKSFSILYVKNSK